MSLFTLHRPHNIFWFFWFWQHWCLFWFWFFLMSWRKDFWLGSSRVLAKFALKPRFTLAPGEKTLNRQIHCRKLINKAIAFFHNITFFMSSRFIKEYLGWFGVKILDNGLLLFLWGTITIFSQINIHNHHHHHHHHHQHGVFLLPFNNIVWHLTWEIQWPGENIYCNKIIIIFSYYHRVFLSPIFVDIWPWRSDAGSVSPIFALVSPSIHANNAAWNIQNIYQQYLFIKERRLSYFQNIHMKCQRPASFQISIKYDLDISDAPQYSTSIYIYISNIHAWKLLLPAGKQWPGLSPSPKVVVSNWKGQN